MTASPLRLGLIGCGRVAELGYLPAARACPAVKLVAVADPDASRRAALAGAELASYGTVEELVGASGVEAVVIASPPDTHEHAARVTTAAGLPTLVEKPPAPDLAGAERIATLTPAPWIGFNRRFSLGAGAAGLACEGGRIDLMLRYRRFSWAPVSVRDPALVDLAPHLIDLALLAGCGEPRRVSARSQRPERLELHIEGGSATVRIECACDRPHRERLAIRDAAGSVTLRRSLGGPGGLVSGMLGRRPHPLVASLAAQLAELARAVRGEGPVTLARAAHGVAVMRVVAAAATSLARGGEPVPPARAIVEAS